MAYPEKSTVGTKTNRRPVTDPEGQLSANEINEIVIKLNKNALFHGVFSSLSQLQATFANPTPGDFAYLNDGTHYRCVSIGWTTKSTSSNGVNYFYGYHISLPALRIAHAVGIPGARAIIKVEGGNDKEALWDEDAGDWFEFTVQSISQQYIDDQDAATLAAAKAYAQDLLGAPSGENKINAFSAGYLGGLSYAPYANFDFGSTNFVITTDPLTPITLDPADVTFSRIDLLVANSNGTISKITGIPAENPVEPAFNIETQLKAAFILIEANAVAPAGVSLIPIYDENTGTAGGEHNVSITQGIGWNLEDLSDPKNATKAIKGTNLQDMDQLNFTPGAYIPGGEFTELVLYVKNLSISTLDDPFYFYIFGDTASNRGRGTATQFLEALSKYGYDKNNITDWQFIAIPVSVLGITAIHYLQLVNKEIGFNVLIDQMSYNDGSAPTGKEFATTGYVIKEIEAAKTEVLDAAKAYTDEIDNVILVSTNRNLAITDKGKILHVTNNVTLTYPNGGILKMHFNIRCTDTGQVTMAGQAADLDLPNKIILAGKAATFYIEPINGKLTGYGELSI